MLSIIGKDEIIKNIYRISRIGNPTDNLSSTSQLRTAYLQFLARKQPSVPVNWSEDVFITDTIIERQLAKAFSIGNLDDLDQSDVIKGTYNLAVRTEKLNLAANALKNLMQLSQDLQLVFGLAIHSIFTTSSKSKNGNVGAHGGSTSGAIGVIWLTIADFVNLYDLMEMYVHELTHCLIFIDELNHPQFNYQEIVKPENHALSAILRGNRPLDKVIHSIIVSTELLSARHTFLGEPESLNIHPDSKSLAHYTIKSIESVRDLKNLDNLVSPRITTLLDLCLDKCHSIPNLDLG